MLKSDEEFFKLSFPSPLEETGVSNKIAELDTEQVGNVSVPSRGDWGF